MTHLCSQSLFWVWLSFRYSLDGVQSCMWTKHHRSLYCSHWISHGEVYIERRGEGSRLSSDEDLHVALDRYTELRSLDFIVQLPAGSLSVDAYSSASFESEAIYRRNSSAMWKLHPRPAIVSNVVLTQSIYERPVQ